MKNKLVKINLMILFFIVVLTITTQAQTADNAKMPLSAAQMQSVEDIRTKAAREAAPLATKLAATVKQVYANMFADKPNEKLRKRLSKQMTDTTVKILLIKGQTIRDMINLLTPEQKTLLKTEMTKPGAPTDLSELMERVFTIPKQ